MANIQLTCISLICILSHLSSFCLCNQSPTDMCMRRYDCFVTCVNGSHTDLGAAILHTANQHLNEIRCHDNITLYVSFELRFPNESVPPRWLQMPPNSSISIYQIFWDLYDLKHIDSHAFDTPPFRRTHSMELRNLNDNIRIEPGAFTALPALRCLQLLYVHTVHLPDLLGTMGATGNVQELQIISGLTVSYPLELVALTGSRHSRTVQKLLITANLRRSLQSHTLSGLTAVQQIDLSNCNLLTIPRNAFHAMSRTLRVLILRGNDLRTLPTGLFSAMLPKAGPLSIELDGNVWKCDCDLRDLQNYMRMYPTVFASSVECVEPAALQGRTVKEARFCESTWQGQPIRENFRLVECGFGATMVGLGKCGGGYSVALAKPPDSWLKIFLNSDREHLSVDVYFAEKSWSFTGALIYGTVVIDERLHRLVVTEMGPFLLCVRESQIFAPLHCVQMGRKTLVTSGVASIWLNKVSRVEVTMAIIGLMAGLFLGGTVAGALIFRHWPCIE